jgi:hypothetical protein
LCYKYTAPSSLFSCRGIEYMLLLYFYIFPSISRHPLCVCVCVCDFGGPTADPSTD